MNGYLSDNSYSRSSSGGYLDAMKAPDWNKIFSPISAGAGANNGFSGPTAGDFRDYIPTQRGSLMNKTGINDNSAIDAINAQQFGGRQQMHDLKMQEIMGPLQAKLMGEYEMMKMKLAQSEAESMRQRQDQHQGYLNSLGQRRYNTYLGYGI